MTAVEAVNAALTRRMGDAQPDLEPEALEGILEIARAVDAGNATVDDLVEEASCWMQWCWVEPIAKACANL